ncbi:MAG: MBL fold metallo-hydrolase [Acidiferrobacterales bacterium]|nr:MBL fold metallo-hydrolase [Acidiferrobacterales bacterium]
MNERIAPENWYRTKKLADEVTLISEYWVKEYYRCNIWHVRGRDRDMLVDSGMGVVNLREQIPMLTEKACLAVASHTHFDHIGAHNEFEHRLVHRLEADVIANPTAETTLSDIYVSDNMFRALPPAPYQSTEYAVKKAPATQLLEDGDVIDLGNRRFLVIHTPGHSPGGIALFEESTGILFSGDLVYDGPLIEDNYNSDAADYYRSMVRLLELPVNIVHAGHFRSYDRARHQAIIRAWLDEKDAG